LIDQLAAANARIAELEKTVSELQMRVIDCRDRSSKKGEPF
jgi:hypothetical protein